MVNDMLVRRLITYYLVRGRTEALSLVCNGNAVTVNGVVQQADHFCNADRNRGRNCSLEIAAAEHYLQARVYSGACTTTIGSVLMSALTNVMHELYDWGKLLRLMGREGQSPESRPDIGVTAWMRAGAIDGVNDSRGRNNVGHIEITIGNPVYLGSEAMARAGY